MKKVIIFFFSIILLVGCGSEESETSSDLSMDSFVNAFSNGDISIEEDKPMYSLIGAKDGIMFYNEGKVVKIYEFSSKEDIKKAEKELPAMKDWVRNGLFVLETSHGPSKEIFNNVK